MAFKQSTYIFSWHVMKQKKVTKLSAVENMRILKRLKKEVALFETKRTMGLGQQTLAC